MRDLTLTVARTLEELESLRPAWDVLLRSQLNADADYFVTALHAVDAAARPHVVLATRGDEPRAVAVARIERTTLPAKIGYRVVYAPRLRILTLVYGGVLGDPDEHEVRALFNELRAALARGEADVLRLRNVELASPLHRLGTRAPPFILRQHVRSTSAHWELPLPHSLDELLASGSSSFRKSVRYDERRLARKFGGRLMVEFHHEPEQLERFFAAAASVGARTYQHGIGVAFGDRELDRRLAELAAARGWFRGYVLSVDGVSLAFWHGVVHNGTFHLGTPGYDPAYAHLRIGNYLLLRLIEDICADASVGVLDFGFGDAFYKRRLGRACRLEEDVLVYAPTLRSLRVNAAQTILAAFTRSARFAAERVPGLQSLKRAWRRRLAGRVERENARRPRLVPQRLPVAVAGASVLAAAAFAAAAALDVPATSSRHEVLVAAPASDVWRLLAEFERYQSWNPFITDADGTPRVGHTVNMRIEADGESPRTADCEILVVRYPRKLHWRCRTSVPGLLDREHTFRLLPAEGGRIRLVYEGRWEGVLVLFEELGARKEGYVEMIEAVKRFAEAGSRS